jgi:hypothetical protein
MRGAIGWDEPCGSAILIERVWNDRFLSPTQRTDKANPLPNRRFNSLRWTSVGGVVHIGSVIGIAPSGEAIDRFQSDVSWTLTFRCYLFTHHVLHST